MVELNAVAGDVWMLGSWQAAPGHGMLPVNAFVVGAERPLLVDTGLPSDGDELLAALWSLVPPADLAAVFLTHDDPDHAGNLLAVLEAAPGARLITNYVTLSRLLEAGTVPLERVHVVNAGDEVPGAHGRLRVLRPPVYDSPGTLGLYDAGTGCMFTADAFGTYLPDRRGELRGTGRQQLLAGLWNFNRMNHPWTAVADAGAFAASIDEVADLEPAVLLSSHGLPAAAEAALLLDGMRDLPTMSPYQPPDQHRFEQLRPEMGG